MKSKKYIDWQCEVFFQLNQEQVQDILKELREYFDPEKHQIHLELTALYPENKFYTKKGTISANTQDISNWEKTIIDCVFLPRYSETPVPYGAPNLSLDDKYVTKCISSKAASSNEVFEIGFTVEILDLKRECP